jgi:hypothetical protein
MPPVGIYYERVSIMVSTSPGLEWKDRWDTE